MIGVCLLDHANKAVPGLSSASGPRQRVVLDVRDTCEPHADESPRYGTKIIHHSDPETVPGELNHELPAGCFHCYRPLGPGRGGRLGSITRWGLPAGATTMLSESRWLGFKFRRFDSR